MPSHELPPGCWDLRGGAKKQRVEGYKNLSWKRDKWQHDVPDERSPPLPTREAKDKAGFAKIRVPAHIANIGNNKPMAVEICCGHAGLTAALWDAGLEAVGVDWCGNKHQTVIPIVQIDLTSQE